MLKGFRDFLLRGNVVDLAVAFVIGAAFIALISNFTASFIQPVINVIMGGGVSGGTVKLDDANRLDFGSFLNAAITFTVTAAVVYFACVLPLQKLAERGAANDAGEADGQRPEPPTPDVVLLTEIRDLLATQRNAAPGSSA